MPEDTPTKRIIAEEHEREYGVEYDDGFVAIMGDEDEAHATHQMTGGKVVTREVYMTAWTAVKP